MTTKDWLLLIIPIVCNGIFIFVFQQIIISRKDAKDQRREIIIDMISVCLGYLNDFTSALYDLSEVRHITMGANHYQFDNAYEKTSIEMRKIIQFATTHPIFLSKDVPSLKHLIEAWREVEDRYHTFRFQSDSWEMEIERMKDIFDKLNSLNLYANACIVECEKKLLQ